VVSRITGLGRIVAIAAVLGPTYLGNTFQAVNQMPNLAYQAMTGSLLTVLLVPPLVAHADARDSDEAERVACGFLGLAMLAFAAVTAAALLAGPILLRLLSLGVQDAEAAAAQRHAGWILLVLVIPQVVLYAVAGAGEAVQNAHGRFALAAAAPAFENVGIILVMGIAAMAFRTTTDIGGVSTNLLVLLGLGSTLSVLTHAAAQWWGAHRVGVDLVPRAGWRDPDVRHLARQALPSLGNAGLNAIRFFGMLVVANSVPGGVVALQLAVMFLYVPTAVGAWPVAVALLPRLSRLYLAGALSRFRDELVRGCGLALLVVIPATVFAITLAGPLSRVVTYGNMANSRGQALVAASLAALGFGLLGEAAWVLGTHAAYARKDATAPFRASIVRLGVSSVGMVVALLAFRGTAVLVVLGLAVSLGNTVGAWYLAAAVARHLPAGDARLTPAAVRTVGGSLAMAAPAYVLAMLLPRLSSARWADLVGVGVAGLVGITIFLVLQRSWHSPELLELRRGFGKAGAGPAQ
jgi:putative peptidoglycan lipid II flippase